MLYVYTTRVRTGHSYFEREQNEMVVLLICIKVMAAPVFYLGLDKHGMLTNGRGNLYSIVLLL